MNAATRTSGTTLQTIGDRGRGFVVAVTIVAVLVNLPAGIWLLLGPESFAEAVRFPANVHFEHDAGAFLVGIGVTLLFSLAWRDGLALAMAGFLAANTIHVVNHAVDLDLGGRVSDVWGLGALSVLTAAALWIRLQQLGWVVGEVTTATTPALAPLVRQKTVLLTTYRKDGRPGSSPLSIAVEGDRAYIRSFETSLKTRRMRNNPEVEVRPSTGNPKNARPTGPPVRARARQLHGAEYTHAARLLRRKHPFLHGVAVPLMHRLGRRKTGRTVHFELTSAEGQS